MSSWNRLTGRCATIRIRSIAAVAAVFLTACTSTKFLPYQGAQQDWPTAPGAFAETFDGVSVYRGLPPKPYDVVGQLELERRTWMAPSVRKKAAAVAREHGADAVIVLDEGRRLLGFFDSTTGTFTPSGKAVQYSGTSQSQAKYAETALVLLIRFR